MDLKQTLITAGIALLTNPSFAGGPVIVAEEPPIAEVRPQGDGGSWVVPVIVGAIVLCAIACGAGMTAPSRRSRRATVTAAGAEMIAIPQDKLPALVRAVYDMSVPVGLGFLHARPGSLTDDEIAQIIEPEGRIAARMDYVNGRQCKMTVFRAEDGALAISDTWFDHSDYQLRQLLDEIGVEATQPTP